MSRPSDDSRALREGPFFAPRGPRPVGPYPHARRFGSLLFVSGIGPRHPETDAIGEGIEAQTRGCIENVKAILEDAGSSLDRVIDVTVFLTDMVGDFAAYNRVYGEYFGAIAPTRTTVGVVALPTAISIELKVIAEAPAVSPNETPSSP
jgi:2-aminomuconate deaminase